MTSRSGWGWVSWSCLVGVTVVGSAFEASVELGGPTVHVRDDVVDVAVGGGDVAAGGVLAVAVADLDGAAEPAGERAGVEAAMTVNGPSNRIVSISAAPEVRHQRAGGDDGAVGQFAQSGEASFTDEHGEQRAGAVARRRGWRRSGWPSRRGRRRVVRRGADDPGGLVGEVLLAFQPVELGGDDGAVDGVEAAVETHRAVQGRRGVQVARSAGRWRGCRSRRRRRAASSTRRPAPPGRGAAWRTARRASLRHGRTGHDGRCVGARRAGRRDPSTSGPRPRQPR